VEEQPTMVKRMGLAALAVALVMAGAAWGGSLAPLSQASAPQAASAPAPAINRSFAGARDSYADVVQVVIPAVVTIRVEGRAAMSPTAFGGDDFFRRFFGDQFDAPRGDRGPRGGGGWRR